MKFSSKSAQLSIFIVIGTMLIIGTIAFLIFGNNSIPLFADERNSASIKDFVESCLEFEGERAIDRLGATGGWLYHTPMVFTNRDLSSNYNRRAQGLNFLEKVEMPYWYYFDDSSNNFAFNIPEYDSNSPYSMKNQLKRYLEENIERNCIQNFDQFQDRYDVKYDPSKYDFDVVFREDFIEVSLDLDLQILETTTNTTEFVSLFSKKLENKLRIPYALALDIVKAESNSSFVEKRILHFLNPYQTSSTKDLLPPFYDFRMTYDFKSWNLRDVEKLIQNLVSAHIGKVQLLNTDYKETLLTPELRNNEFAVSLNNLYTKDYLSEHTNTQEEFPRIFREYKNYEVEPTYESFFPSSIEISPSMGNEILLPRPQSIISLIPFFFTEYVSVYEITMPIVFEIKPSDSNDNFVFNLPIEANIDHNTPLKENVDFGFGLDDLQGEVFPPSLVCDPSQFVSEFVYLNITDPIAYGERGPLDSKTGVDNAIVNFNCKGIATCFVGSTEINGRYEEEKITELKFRLPLNCGPGSIEVYKYGHKKVNINNIFPDLEREINLGEFEMPSQKDVNLRVRLVGEEDSRFSEGRTVRDNERGFIIFENLEDKDIVQVAEINSEVDENDLFVSLLPGNYSVNGFLTYDDEITIEAQQFCYQKGLFSGQECQEVPEIVLESWLAGGLEYPSFEVTKKELLNAKRLTVNIIEYGIPATYDSLQSSADRMGNLESASLNKEPYFDFE